VLNQRDTAISGARTTALFPVIAVSQAASWQNLARPVNRPNWHVRAAFRRRCIIIDRSVQID
jgi:hypothetical protein